MNRNLLTLHSEIMPSKGMKYINRSYGRTFTRNIFEGNTKNLLRLLHEQKDPEKYLNTFASGDLEVGDHVFREMARMFHNFLAGAITIVDHTRVLVGEHYIGTEVNKEYKSRIERDFSKNPLTRFVQDLRNYMTHRGLPPLNRHLTLERLEGAEPGKFRVATGFQLPRDKLKEWKNWKADALAYLYASEEYIDVLRLAEAYHSVITNFHNEFDDLLQLYHKADLDDLAAMQAKFRAQHGNNPADV